MGKKIRLSMKPTQRLVLANIFTQLMHPELDLPPVLLEGAMGVGKTAVPSYVCKMLGKYTKSKWGFYNIKLATRQITDIQGVPYPGEIDGVQVLKWLKDPTTLPGIIKEQTPEYGIVMLDEFPQITNEDMIAATYELLNEKRLGEYKYPRKWFFILGGNRAEDGGLYSRLKAPIRDRILIIDTFTTKDEWVDWARLNHAHPAVISFVDESDGDHDVLHTYDAELEKRGDTKGENYVFSTHRSMEVASKYLYGYEAKDELFGVRLLDNDTLKYSLQADLGEEVGGRLHEHYQQRKDIDIESLYNIEWQSGFAVGNITNVELTPANITYIADTACYPEEDNSKAEEKSYKLLMYLLSKNVDSQGISLIINSYTTKQLNSFKEFLARYDNASLFDIAERLRNVTENTFDALLR